jgi:hypothetical protein
MLQELRKYSITDLETRHNVQNSRFKRGARQNFDGTPILLLLFVLLHVKSRDSSVGIALG